MEEIDVNKFDTICTQKGSKREYRLVHLEFGLKLEVTQDELKNILLESYVINNFKLNIRTGDYLDWNVYFGKKEKEGIEVNYI